MLWNNLHQVAQSQKIEKLKSSVDVTLIVKYNDTRKITHFLFPKTFKLFNFQIFSLERA